MKEKKEGLSFQLKLTLLICFVILTSLSITGYLIGSKAVERIKLSQEQRVMDTARTMSYSQVLIDGLTHERDNQLILDYAEKVESDTNLEYVVVMDMNGIRKTHPNKALIGQAFVGGDEKRALEGEFYTSLAQGTLGKSLRGFAPVFNGEEQVGVVAVGIMYSDVESQLLSGLTTSIVGVIVGLVLGTVGAFIIARRLKKTLFGLEPEEIAQLLLERDAVIESVREGLVAINDRSEVLLINQAAKDLFKRAGLDFSENVSKIPDTFSHASLESVFKTGKPSYNQERNVNGLDIVINRIPVIHKGKIVAALATFQDKTELTALVERLSGAEAFAETLRVQTHEFMNKLQIISAMVQTESYEELAAYLAFISETYQQDMGSVTEYIKDPIIAGYLIHKFTEARECGVETELVGEHDLPKLKQTETMDAILTIIGNLYDNAVEAVREISTDEKVVYIETDYSDGFFYFFIEDSKENTETIDLDRLFERGYSHKGKTRGYGLYLVEELVGKLDGRLDVSLNERNGLRFQVVIPYEEACHD